MLLRIIFILFSFLTTACSHTNSIEPSDVYKNEELVRRGVRYLRLSDIPKAEAAFQVAYQILPTSAAADGLGVVEFYKGNLSSAEDWFIKAYYSENQYFQSLVNLAGLYEARGFYEAAIYLYRFVLKYEPDNFQARNNLAILLHDLGSEEALVELRRAYTLDNDPIITNNLSILTRSAYGKK